VDSGVQVARTERVDQARVNANPEIALEVFVRLRRVNLQRKHQLLHKFYKPAVSGGACNDAMEVGVALDLRLLVQCLATGSGFGDDLVKLREVVCRQASDAQLDRKHDQRVQDKEDLGAVLVCPLSYVGAPRPAPLDDAELLELVHGIAHRRAAHLKNARKLLSGKPLAGSKDALANAVEHFEHNPIAQMSISG